MSILQGGKMVQKVVSGSLLVMWTLGMILITGFVPGIQLASGDEKKTPGFEEDFDSLVAPVAELESLKGWELMGGETVIVSNTAGYSPDSGMDHDIDFDQKAIYLRRLDGNEGWRAGDGEAVFRMKICPAVGGEDRYLVFHILVGDSRFGRNAFSIFFLGQPSVGKMDNTIKVGKGGESWAKLRHTEYGAPDESGNNGHWGPGVWYQIELRFTLEDGRGRGLLSVYEVENPSSKLLNGVEILSAGEDSDSFDSVNIIHLAQYGVRRTQIDDISLSRVGGK
jgi:hypothetical protein